MAAVGWGNDVVLAGDPWGVLDAFSSSTVRARPLTWKFHAQPLDRALSRECDFVLAWIIDCFEYHLLAV